MEAPSQRHPDPAGVCVYAPSTIVTVTVEGGEEGDDIHFHAGGQGFWIARLLARLGVPTTMCTVFGGESGRVARALVEAESIEVRGVEVTHDSGAYVHDRRTGDRRTVADRPAQQLRRHDADDLYGVTLTSALEAGICVLAGPHGGEAVEPEQFRRLATDLRREGTVVIADLSGPELVAALAGGVDFCKVSDEDLQATEAVDASGSPRDAVQALCRAGARHAALTRGAAPLVASVDGRLVEVRSPNLEAVDHRGAGDAFTALIAATQFWGIDWLDGLRWAAAAGALTVARRGLATADRGEIHRILDRVEVGELGGSGHGD